MAAFGERLQELHGGQEQRIGELARLFEIQGGALHRTMEAKSNELIALFDSTGPDLVELLGARGVAVTQAIDGHASDLQAFDPIAATFWPVTALIQTPHDADCDQSA